jgi:hypothetical protein
MYSRVLLKMRKEKKGRESGLQVAHTRGLDPIDLRGRNRHTNKPPGMELSSRSPRYLSAKFEIMRHLNSYLLESAKETCHLFLQRCRPGYLQVRSELMGHLSPTLS